MGGHLARRRSGGLRRNGRFADAGRHTVGDAWILTEDEGVPRARGSAAAARLLPAAARTSSCKEPIRSCWSLILGGGELWTSRVWPGAVLVEGEVAGTWRRAGAVVTIKTWRRLPPVAPRGGGARSPVVPLAGVQGQSACAGRTRQRDVRPTPEPLVASSAPWARAASFPARRRSMPCMPTWTLKPQSTPAITVAPDEVGVAPDPLRHELRVLDVVRLRFHHARAQDLVVEGGPVRTASTRGRGAGSLPRAARCGLCQTRSMMSARSTS